MNPRRTTVFLVAVVLGLAGAVWWQRERERSGTFALDRALFPGLAGAEIEQIRLDHLERGLELTLRRDDAAGWLLVDPIEYPAEVARVAHLIEVLTTNTAVEIAPRDLKQIGLDPPRAVLEVSVRGASQPLRLELGALDLDGQNVFARVDGRLVRTLRNIDTALERELYQWRRSAILDMSAPGVISFFRSGKIVMEDQTTLPLALAAERDDTNWRASEPFHALLDPRPVEAWLYVVCGLRAHRFVDIEGDPAIYRSGEPDMTIELEDVRAVHEILDFRHVEGGGWLCTRRGRPEVFAVEEENVLQLAVPALELVDLAFTRLAGDAVERIRLIAPEGERTIDREGTAWRVAPAYAPGALRKADSAVVIDLLSALERTRFLKIESDPQPAEPPDRHWELWIEAPGLLLGVSLWRPEAGPADIVYARRADEDLTYLADASLLTLAETPIETLWERQVVGLPELGVARIELAYGGKTRTYVRNAKTGRWSPPDRDVEARELLPVLERLLSVRAERILPIGEKHTASAAVDVTVVPSGGDVVKYKIGLDGEHELFEDATTHAYIVPGLHAQLVALMTNGS